MIDARPAADYQCGHIPTALSVPAPDNLDPASHLLLPPKDLALLWQQVGLDSAPRHLGNGITGLYDGSWIEWGADPDLPVETRSGQTS